VTEILAGTLILAKAMAWTPCVEKVIYMTNQMSHTVIKAEKNNVQVLLHPNNKNRYGLQCTNGQMRIYKKELNN
jgi:hypothetical protein